MACSIPHSDDEIQALVQKQIDEDMVHQKAILDLALQFDNACTTKEDLRKAYEKCNHIPQESRALIDTFLKEAWIHEKYNHRSETHIGGSSSQTHEIGDVYLTAEELHQLHLDEKALRETLEEQTIDEKAREEKIRQKQADDDEYFMGIWGVIIDSDYVMDSNFTNENDPWEYSLDIDDSDLHLTHVLRSSSSAHVEPSPYTPNPVTIIPGPAGVVQLSNSICVEPSSSTPNPVRIIPGPAGLVQRAKLLKENVFILDPDGALMSTQEYMQKVIEDVGEDADFNSGAWVSAHPTSECFWWHSNGCLETSTTCLKREKTLNKLLHSEVLLSECSGDLNVTLTRSIRPKFDEKAKFELKGQFLKELHDNIVSGSDDEDANEHIERVLEIVDLFTVPNVTQDQLILRVFPISLTRAASRWLRNEPAGLITTWEILKGNFLSKYYPPAHTAKRMEILDSKGVVPKINAADAKKSIQEMVGHSQKWHNGTSTRNRSSDTSYGSATIQAQLNNLGTEINKVIEKVYAAQVGCESCNGPHYSKDFPLKEEGKALEEAYYTQFGVPFPQGGRYSATPLRFYQRDNGNPLYQERRQKGKNH
ncbi:hypothetical protein Tco_0573641 [Tanacetum coccineum]